MAPGGQSEGRGYDGGTIRAWYYRSDENESLEH